MIDPTEPANYGESDCTVRASLIAGGGYFVATSLIVWLAVLFACDFVTLCQTHPYAYSAPYFDRFVAWDGEWYARIVKDGYSYHADRMSNVAFFPVYPLLAKCLSVLLCLDPVHALVLTSNLFLFAAFVLAYRYTAIRWPDASPTVKDYVLLAMGLFPSSLYFRMGYTESTFLFLAILSLYAMQRNWPLWQIAMIVGLASGTRTVGVALLAPLGMHILETSSNLRNAILRGLAIGPLAIWGLLAYVGFLWIAFDEPLAFVKTQQHWGHQQDLPQTLLGQALGLVTLRPLQVNYFPNCYCYWARVPPVDNIFFNLRFANPIYFSVAVGAIGIGSILRWLNRKECLYGLCLMAIPYVLHAQRTCMDGETRYASLVFPLYLVVGRALAAAPGPLTSVVSSLSAFLLAAYTALFVSWYWYY